MELKMFSELNIIVGLYLHQMHICFSCWNTGFEGVYVRLISLGLKGSFEYLACYSLLIMEFQMINLENMWTNVDTFSLDFKIMSVMLEGFLPV